LARGRVIGAEKGLLIDEAEYRFDFKITLRLMGMGKDDQPWELPSAKLRLDPTTYLCPKAAVPTVGKTPLYGEGEDHFPIGEFWGHARTCG
jgi:hypothetical protein